MRYYLAICIMLASHAYSFSQNSDDSSHRKSLIAFRPFLSAYFYYGEHEDDSAIHYFSDTTDIRRLYPSYILTGFQRGICKEILFVYQDTSHPQTMLLLAEKKAIVPVPQLPKKKPFLTVHGNIYYDVYYQSNIDTPFIEKDIYQHTIRTYLDVTVKDQYPLRVSFTTRFSNSSLFKDFTGLGFQFNLQNFKNIVATKLQDYAIQQLSERLKTDSLKALIDNKTNQLLALKNNLNSPSLLQKLIEAKEAAYTRSRQLQQKRSAEASEKMYSDSDKENPDMTLGKSPLNINAFFSKKLHRDSTVESKENKVSEKMDTAVAASENLYALQKKKYDSLSDELSKLQKVYEQQKEKYHSLQAQLNEISKTKNASVLIEKLKEMHLEDTVLPKGYKTLLAVRSFGIGRTSVDYSELSAKNISITGIQAEYNPHYYFAFASGVIDYQFRDYVVNNVGREKQYLNIARFGKGQKDGNNIIITFYQGKKQLYNYYSTGNNAQPAPDYKIAGFTIESRYQLNQNNYVIFEAGKSSLPYYRRVENKESILQSVVRFNDHLNEAYSFKMSSFIPQTNTKITGFYKHMGADFQSFSFFTTSATQNAWSVKIEQPFFKYKLRLVGALRKNDFTNPYLENSYQSNILFKSIQATVRIRKLPVVSVGYFPSTQLIKLNDLRYMENLYYTFTGSISHYYKYRSVQLNSLLCYTRFYNRQSDSNFVYYNTKNILFSQLAYFKKFTLQANIAQAINTSYRLYTAGGNLEIKVKDWLSLGGGLKYNEQTIISNKQLGYNFSTTVKVLKIGTFQVYAEKGFIPGVNRQLVENNTGRFTFMKVF